MTSTTVYERRERVGSALAGIGFIIGMAGLFGAVAISTAFGVRAGLAGEWPASARHAFLSFFAVCALGGWVIFVALFVIPKARE